MLPQAQESLRRRLGGLRLRLWEAYALIYNLGVYLLASFVLTEARAWKIRGRRCGP